MYSKVVALWINIVRENGRQINTESNTEETITCPHLILPQTLVRLDEKSNDHTQREQIFVHTVHIPATKLDPRSLLQYDEKKERKRSSQKKKKNCISREILILFSTPFLVDRNDPEDPTNTERQKEKNKTLPSRKFSSKKAFDHEAD